MILKREARRQKDEEVQDEEVKRKSGRRRRTRRRKKLKKGIGTRSKKMKEDLPMRKITCIREESEKEWTIKKVHAK